MEVEYRYFAIYYREIIDYLSGLEAKEEELLEREERIPLSLKREINRHTIISNILAQIGQEKYKKDHEELYKDGWRFLADERKKKGTTTW